MLEFNFLFSFIMETEESREEERDFHEISLFYLTF